MAADPQLLLIAGGSAAIVGAAAWRLVARRLERSRLQRRLRVATEAVERARAGHQFVELGLRRAARPLLSAMAHEDDERVRRSIALAIARRQWEPSGPPRVTQVRRWASDELGYQGQPVRSFGPAVTRLSDMGGPRLPQPANGAGGRPPAAPEAATPPLPPPAPRPAPEPARPSTIQLDAGPAPIHWDAPRDEEARP
ncbi:MAG TPA: hypothetical protein VG869_09940 [Acidimicrobiia bacterium]|jgi:hypothetical protein|nr:hypothetical protein [Acidimicrobiia bacterium]HEV3451515.1 hypothetical protein [Acidimicrobiia bacterium]